MCQAEMVRNGHTLISCKKNDSFWDEVEKCIKHWAYLIIW